MRMERIKKGDNIPFTVVPNSMLRCANLSLKAKGLYAYLYSKPDDYDFAAARIALENIDGRDAVLAGMNELLASGYVTRQKLGTGRIEYTIWVEPKTEKPVLDPEPEKPTVGISHRGEIPLISKTDTVVNKDSEINKDFEAFWKVYPRKVGKTAARRHYAAAFKRNRDLTPEAILKALSVQTQQLQWTKDGGVFIPHASTWLNQERWNDEIDLEKEKTVAESKKKPYIDGDPAYQKGGKWYVITYAGNHCLYEGKMDKLEWR